MLKDLRVDRESENDSLDYAMVERIKIRKLNDEYVELLRMKQQVLKERTYTTYVLMCSIILLVFLIIVSFKLIVTKGVL